MTRWSLAGALAGTGVFAGLAAQAGGATVSAKKTTTTSSSTAATTGSSTTSSSLVQLVVDDRRNVGHHHTEHRRDHDDHGAYGVDLEQLGQRHVGRVVMGALIPNSTLWYPARGTGFVAVIMLTISVALGIVTTMRWSSAHWPRFITATLHKNISLLSVVFLTIHVLSTLFDPVSPVHLLNAIVPFTGTYRPLGIGLGVVAIDLLAALIVTSLLRQRIGYRVWRGSALERVRVLAGRDAPRVPVRLRRRDHVGPGRVPVVRGTRGGRSCMAGRRDARRPGPGHASDICPQARGCLPRRRTMTATGDVHRRPIVDKRR